MAKFNITQWANFVREVDTGLEHEMRQALAGGDTEVLRTVELLRQVAELGKSDHELEIPEYAVRGAKAIGSLRRPELEEAEPKGLLRYLPFQLKFDSLLEPATAGTRNLQASDRQLVFEAADYTVEVRLEQEAEPESTVLVGELLRQREALEPVPRIPVFVRSGELIVARSNTGRFGEFQAEGLPTENLSLALMVHPNECIYLPLNAS